VESPKRGPMSEDLEFQTVSSIPDYASRTSTCVSYLPVSRNGELMGFLWASPEEPAAGMEPRISQGAAPRNISVAWVDRFRWAYAAGLTATEALQHWAGAPEDPKCGSVGPGPERVAESLYQLQRLALETDHVGMVRGCLLGGALGDALGYTVEFSGIERIRRLFGDDGIVAVKQGTGEISDDTQLTLFVAEGLAEAFAARTDAVTSVYEASMRWLGTQSQSGPLPGVRGLAAQEWLYRRRAPGNSCLSGLSTRRMGTPRAPANPDSKGCGAVMRSAPFGLVPAYEPDTAFDLAAKCAVHTHGHPSGYLAAGAFAALIRLLYGGVQIEDALHRVLELLVGHAGHEEVTTALNRAIELAASGERPSPEAVEGLGEGWVAEEALAIAVYCALVLSHDGRGEATWTFKDAIKLAVNHSGDSDSTGSICGNIMGVTLGQYALVDKFFLGELEGREQITELADRFAAVTVPEQ
jgi:ADP-ribosylglycohydrolase